MRHNVLQAKLACKLATLHAVPMNRIFKCTKLYFSDSETHTYMRVSLFINFDKSLSQRPYWQSSLLSSRFTHLDIFELILMYVVESLIFQNLYFTCNSIKLSGLEEKIWPFIDSWQPQWLPSWWPFWIYLLKHVILIYLD